MPDHRRVKEIVFQAVIVILTFLTIAPLLHIISSVFVKGLPVLIRGGISFLTDTLAPPSDGLGGVGPAILGTFVLMFLSSLMGLPIALMAGIYSAEYPRSIVGRATKILLTESL